MTKKTAGTAPHGPEPRILAKLRRAVQTSGLNADIAALRDQERATVVSSRLAQTTVRYLTTTDPARGQQLSEELQTLASSQDWNMLMEDRGFTFYHVVQFLYEFAKHYAHIPDRKYFCLGMGRGGGGVEVSPDEEIVSLIDLVVTAMPAGADRSRVSLLMQRLAPVVISKVFPADLLQLEVVPGGEDEQEITVRYVDRSQVDDALKGFGLEGDAGAFFFNTALHVQGTLELGWETFARDASRTVDMSPRIEALGPAQHEQIAQSCECRWRVRWSPDVELNRLTDEHEILAHGQTVYDALHRKDLLYYLERIKTLEMKVQALEASDESRGLIGQSPAMRRVHDLIQQVSGSDLTVLIRGESGTGKELVAHAIHQTSGRADKPFVAVNCAAFTESLLESELFGHERGAFTGADKTKPGRFEMATGGTLFLDEVGDIPLPTQVKLLRALETRTFERVGGTESLQVDVRIIGATNRNLEERIAVGDLREDFYFRLNVLPLELPPLRDHEEDIPQLAQHFLDETALRAGREVRGFASGAIARLTDHTWPGNVRELRNVIERAVVVYARGDVVRADDIEQALGLRPARGPRQSALNRRQHRVLEIIRDTPDGCRVDDLLSAIGGDSTASGSSRRTLQNDLRRLAELGLASWMREGSARVYTISANGRQALDTADR